MGAFVVVVVVDRENVVHIHMKDEVISIRKKNSTE